MRCRNRKAPFFLNQVSIQSAYWHLAAPSMYGHPLAWEMPSPFRATQCLTNQQKTVLIKHSHLFILKFALHVLDQNKSLCVHQSNKLIHVIKHSISHFTNNFEKKPKQTQTLQRGAVESHTQPLPNAHSRFPCKKTVARLIRIYLSFIQNTRMHARTHACHSWYIYKYFPYSLIQF